MHKLFWYVYKLKILLILIANTHRLYKKNLCNSWESTGTLYLSFQWGNTKHKWYLHVERPSRVIMSALCLKLWRPAHPRRFWLLDETTEAGIDWRTGNVHRTGCPSVNQTDRETDRQDLLFTLSFIIISIPCFECRKLQKWYALLETFSTSLHGYHLHGQNCDTCV